MTKNPILDELRETRERLLAEAGGTLEELVAQLQRDERQSGREFVRRKGRTEKCEAAVNPMIYTFHCETCHAETPFDLSNANENVTEIKGVDRKLLQYVFCCPKCGTKQAKSKVHFRVKENKVNI